jgi:guanine deaminase
MNQESRAIVIRGGRLIDVRGHLANPADILIRGDEIVEIGPPGLAVPEDAALIDAAEQLLMPGLVNAHTHGHGGLARGLGDRWTLELLLNAAPWISGNRAPEHKYLSAAIAALEMVAKGCTACYDLYFEIPTPTVEGMQAVAQAYLDVGMRVVVAPMVADRTLYQSVPGLMEALPEEHRDRVEKLAMAPWQETLAACRQVVESWPFDRERARPALAPTIPLHCSDDFLVGCRDLAAELELGYHTHLAESKAQAVAGVARYGRTLTHHLDDLGILGPNFAAAHAVWLDDDDIKRLADNGARAAHNPGSNMRLGSGLAPAAAMARAGVDLGIGTDAVSCSDNQNMFEAMRLASFASRLQSHDYEEWFSTETVLEMATQGSARLLGFGESIGRIAVGAKADVVFLNAGHVNYLPLNDITNQLVHVEEGSGVARVMVGGRMVYENGNHLCLNIHRIRTQVETAVEELRARNAEARVLADAMEPIVGKFCVGLSREPYHVHSLAGRDY